MFLQKGLVLGYYSEDVKDKDTKITGTPLFNELNSKSDNTFTKNLSLQKNLKTGSLQLLCNVDDSYSAVALASLGKVYSEQENNSECFDCNKESVRRSVAGL